jgi:ActR/RegA family two-component response regulator
MSTRSDSGFSARKRVIVIDSDPESSRWLEQCVQGQGYEVRIARDAGSALLAYDDATCAVIANMQGGVSECEAAIRALQQGGRRPKVITFGRFASFATKGILVVLPGPMNARHVETALEIVMGMKALPSIPTPRQMSVRPAA